MQPATRPWYREPWPWLLMAGPAAVVVAGAITTVVAVKTSDPLVADDYYKRGLAVNRDIAREDRAAQLGLTAQVQFSPALDRVRILVPPAAGEPEALRLTLTHPTREAADRSVRLTRESPGVYAGSLAAPGAGRYGVRVEDAAGQWRLDGRWKTSDGTLALGRAG